MINTLTIGKTTFTIAPTDDPKMVWLKGARGGYYFLRGFNNRENLFAIVSAATGQEWRERGNRRLVRRNEAGNLEVASR